jgi:hypothetical protein
LFYARNVAAHEVARFGRSAGVEPSGEPSGVPSTIDGVQREAVPVQPSMLWPDHDNQALKPAERQLLDAVASGALDAHLVAIADAVQARRALLDTVRSANVVAELCLGDTVMFNRAEATSMRPRR